MNRTEKIIDRWESATTKYRADEAMSEVAEECRRLARLCDAYWREIEMLRELDDKRCDCCGCGGTYEQRRTLYRLMEATDAARREAGEETA